MKTIEKITSDLQTELTEDKPNKKRVLAYQTALNLRKNADKNFLKKQLDHIDIILSKKENQLEVCGINAKFKILNKEITELRYKRSIVNYVLNANAEL